MLYETSETIMIIGFIGEQGSGKTLAMSILAYFISTQTGVDLYSNYHLLGAKNVSSFTDILRINKAIFCFDEIWISVDSRNWKNNSLMSHWINQTRKKQLAVFYTTQSLDQVEKRIRNATDLIVSCERNMRNGTIILYFIDGHSLSLKRKIKIPDPELYYPLYDTYQEVSIIN